MRIRKISAWCYRCRDHTTHSKHTLNHLPHFFASLFTGGFWLPFWIYLNAALPEPVCGECGAIYNEQRIKELNRGSF